MKTAVDTYREFWKQWIAESYGQETADKAKFDLNEHKWIESAMKAYASEALREAAEKKDFKKVTIYDEKQNTIATDSTATPNLDSSHKEDTQKPDFEREAELRYPVTTHSNPSYSPYSGIKRTFLHGCNYVYNTHVLPLKDSLRKAQEGNKALQNELDLEKSRRESLQIQLINASKGT